MLPHKVRDSLAARVGQASVMALLLLSTACTSVGPGSGSVLNAEKKGDIQGIQIIEVSDATVQQLRQKVARPGFAETLAPAQPVGTVIEAGDVLEIAIWEAPPAVLFSTTVQPTSTETSRSTSIPQYMVEPSGVISVPFAGNIQVAGRSLADIERDVTRRLQGKAHLPQVVARLVRNNSANVTVIGDVVSSLRMPLTPKGERVLDALAAAGGSRQPTNKVTIQISRDNVVQSMPLEAVVQDPRQNVVLRSGDVVTALFQPYSFTVLGAAAKNEEVNFEATGLTLAQALGRVGGLQDGRADPKGAFLFRWEVPSLVTARDPGVQARADGKIPVIYRINMKDPTTYFTMQNFPIRDKDVLYVANSPVAEFQRFVGVMASTVLPIVAVDNAVSQ